VSDEYNFEMGKPCYFAGEKRFVPLFFVHNEG